MKFQSLKLLRFFQFILALVVLFACSSKETTSEDPEAIYKQAEEAMKDEHYQTAVEKYRDLKNRFPYSSRAVDAELRVADAYFAQEAFIESASSYEIFKELHPTHSKIDYVQYRIGLSYSEQIPDNPTRDLSAAHKAIQAYEYLIEKHSSSEFVKLAKEKLLSARRSLAVYEHYVADFYYTRHHYLSASYRYSSLLKEFLDLGYDEEALYRLGECYYHIRMFGNARDALQRLLAKFPQSSFRGQAEGLLASLGKES